MGDELGKPLINQSSAFYDFDPHDTWILVKLIKVNQLTKIKINQLINPDWL